MFGIIQLEKFEFIYQINKSIYDGDLNMNTSDILSGIVKTGICVYGDRQYRAFICQSNVYPGSGDYEDVYEIRDDKEISCFAVWFESIVTKDLLNANGGYYLSLHEAVDAVEKNPGFINWI